MSATWILKSRSRCCRSSLRPFCSARLPRLSSPPLRCSAISAGPTFDGCIYTASRAIIGGITGLVAVAMATAADRVRLGAHRRGTLVGAVVCASIWTCVFACHYGLAPRHGRTAGYRAHRLPLSLLSAVPLYAPWSWSSRLSRTTSSRHGRRCCSSYRHSPPSGSSRSTRQQRHLTEGLTSANRQLESANLSFAAALVATLDARDRYTAGHSAAVAVYSRDIATRMGLPTAISRKPSGGLVHDIGKIGLPPGLLEKEGPLTLEERRVMQGHSEIGERILANVDDYGDIAEIVQASPRTRRRTRLSGWTRRGRDSAALAHHRCCGRIQRHDFRSAIPRGDAEPGRPDAAGAGSRFPIRHDRGGGLRSDTRHSGRCVPAREDAGLRLLLAAMPMRTSRVR